MKNRILLLSLALLLVTALVAVGCAKPAPAPPPAPVPAPVPAPPKPAPPKPPVAKPEAPKVFEWRFSTHWPSASASYAPWKKWFEEDVPELTDGRIKIEFSPAGTFMPTSELFEAWSKGVLDGGVSFAPYYTSQVPLCAILVYFPYAFKDPREHQYFLHHLGFEKAVRDEHLKFGILYWTVDSYPAGPIFKKPIRTIDDLQGVKIRATGALADWYKEAGASPVMIPGAEIYTALATGVVDAAIWGGAAGSYSMKFHEVAKYYMQPYAGACSDSGYISKKAWDALPEDLQKTFDNAISKRFWERTVEYYIKVEAPALKAMVDEHGVEIVWIDEAGQKALLDAALKVWDKTAAVSPLCAHWVEVLRDFHKELGYLD